MGTHSDDIETIRRLFHDQVPEVASGLVEIRGIAREVGVLGFIHALLRKVQLSLK
jgi:hypothetical protein